MSGLNEAYRLIHFKNCHDRLFDGTLANAGDLHDTLAMLDGNMPTFTPEKELYILTLQELVIHQVDTGLTEDTDRYLREIGEYAKAAEAKDNFVSIEFLILASMVFLIKCERDMATRIIREYERMTVTPGSEDFDSIYVKNFLEHADDMQRLLPLFKARMKNMIDNHYDWILRVMGNRSRLLQTFFGESTEHS